MAVLKGFLNEEHSIGVLFTADTVVIEDAKCSSGLLSTGGRVSWPHGTKWSSGILNNKRNPVLRLYSMCLFLLFCLFLLLPEQLHGF